ncbi:hypothetical protein E1162_16905 [Rhodobacteraceae bacterium RKSG542]|uniref:DUF2780 domain-containing protein n=1 Tax=Pseudovibrio flavus TaxID=2529854 RepID=UPI0012BC7492|nr:DUF2780 domain-containing protein [Pseudovibrio flavus]MTI18925.1 hypothetical protein [Pseudovibrio flavus]
MHRLINRIVQKTELEEDTAKAAVGVILNFISKNCSSEDMEVLMDAFPKAEEFLGQQEAKDSSGLLGGLASKMSSTVGVLAALNELTSLGLSMGQIQSVAKMTIKFAKENVGDEKVDAIIKKIPSLSQIA